MIVLIDSGRLAGPVKQGGEMNEFVQQGESVVDIISWCILHPGMHLLWDM